MARLASAEPPHDCERWRCAGGAALIVFFAEAQAQTAEATKAATQAADILLQYQVLGAACVFLLIAVGVLFWLLIRTFGRIERLTELVAGEMAGNRSATLAQTTALERIHAAQAANAEALREQSHETANEIRETRHTVANHHAGVNAVVELLVRRERSSA